MRGKYPSTMLRNPIYSSMSLREIEALRTQFLRAWASQHYREQEEAAHAGNDAREAAGLEQLMRMGVCRDWNSKRVTRKPLAAKKKKPAKKSAARPKKH